MKYATTAVRAGLVASALALAPVTVAGADASPSRVDPGPVSTTPADTGFVTVMFGRSIWMHGCTGGPGVRTLEQSLADLKSRQVSAVGGVVVNRIASTRTCLRGVTYPTWQDMTRFKKNYGWSVVSQGMNYVDMTQLTTDEERYAESGATLAPLAAKGFPTAWGVFNYPNDLQDADAHRVVSASFAFNRLYVETPEVNSRAAITAYPYAMQTFSINGGRCNNPVLPCYSMPVRNDRRTTPLDQIGKVLNPASGRWGVLQLYRLVEGKTGTLGQANAWDCTSPNWRDRWTGHPENFCRNTFLTAIDARKKTAKVVTPATMADLWGRGNPAAP